MAGTVLITFKSPRSIPPYRIENHCDDVFVYFAQAGVAWDRAKWNWLNPRSGGACMAYAWDEPILEHRLSVQVLHMLASCPWHVHDQHAILTVRVELQTYAVQACPS